MPIVIPRATSPVRLAGLTTAALLYCAVALPAAAQNAQLEALERALQEDRVRAEELQRKAEKLETEIRALRAASITAARKAQEYEAQLSAMEARLTDLERDQAGKVADLRARRAQLGGTLAALQRIALQPMGALIVAPGTPVNTLRSAMLLRVAIPAIERQAEVLRGELDGLARLRRRIALQRGELTDTNRAHEAQRDRLSALIGRKSEARAATTVDQKAAQERAARLAAQAKDLRDLLERVEREARERAQREARERAQREALERAQRKALERAQRAAREPAQRAAREPAQAVAPPPAPPPSETRTALAKPENIRPFPSAPASLVMPARGRIVLRYGQSDGDNGASRGLTIATRQDAQVVAPYDGKVVYAGTFRSYGQILIIEHGGRYHTLLAGLERIDAVVGQWLLAGEPVGVLGSMRDNTTKLYLELRRAGQPINPLPWLATTGDKVRG